MNAENAEGLLFMQDMFFNLGIMVLEK